MAPNAEDVTLGESRTWSPLNVLGNVTVENLIVLGTNCRYCLHNDSHNEYPGCKQIYRNCYFEYHFSNLKDGNRLGFNCTTGFGIEQGAQHIYEDCQFIMVTEGNNSAFYGHEGNSNQDGTIVIKNCVFKSSNFSNNRTLRFQSIGTNQGQVRVLIENSYINGGLCLDLYTSDALQNFLITLNNCNRVPVTRVIPTGTVTDIYKTTWYNPLAAPTEVAPLIYEDEA